MAGFTAEMEKEALCLYLMPSFQGRQDVEPTSPTGASIDSESWTPFQLEIGRAEQQSRISARPSPSLPEPVGLRAALPTLLDLACLEREGTLPTP